MNRRACACACARSRPVRHPSGGTIDAGHAAALWLHTAHWYSVAQPAPSGRSTRALRPGRAAQARDSARAWERNSERSNRAASTRLTGRSWTVVWARRTQKADIGADLRAIRARPGADHCPQ